MCSYNPRRRWWFNLAPFLSKEARTFVDTHDRCTCPFESICGMHQAPCSGGHNSKLSIVVSWPACLHAVQDPQAFLAA